MIAESTRKLVGNLFELDDLGSQELKGIAGAVVIRYRSVSNQCCGTECFAEASAAVIVTRLSQMGLIVTQAPGCTACGHNGKGSDALERRPQLVIARARRVYSVFGSRGDS